MVNHKTYYWLVAKDPDSGRPYLIYGGATEEEARNKGLEMLSGIDFDIKGYPTRDLARASSMLRGSRLEDTHDLGQAGLRIGHSKSIRRLRRKRMGF